MNRDEQARATAALFHITNKVVHDLQQHTQFCGHYFYVIKNEGLSIVIYSAIISPSIPESPASMRFWPAPATAPLVAVELEEEVEDAELKEPVADVALPVMEAEAPVSEGPDVADPVGSAVSEVAEEPVAVVLSPARIFSKPAVIVTGNRLFVRSLTTPVITPGSLASGPATV